MRQVKVYVDGVDQTEIGFPQGTPMEKEISFLIYWATKFDYLWVPGFDKYHRAPKRVHVYCPMIGTLIGVKSKGGRLFEVYV